MQSYGYRASRAWARLKEIEIRENQGDRLMPPHANSGFRSIDIVLVCLRLREFGEIACYTHAKVPLEPFLSR